MYKKLPQGKLNVQLNAIVPENFHTEKIWCVPPSKDYRLKNSEMFGLLDTYADRVSFRVPDPIAKFQIRRDQKPTSGETLFIKRDGNSLFRAFAYFLTNRLDNETDHVKIRKSIWDYIRLSRNQQNIRRIVGKDTFEYTSQNNSAMSKPCPSPECIEHVGTHVEIKVFQQLTGCVVHTWSEEFTRSQGLHNQWVNFYGCDEEKPTLFLILDMDDFHYNICKMYP